MSLPVSRNLVYGALANRGPIGLTGKAQRLIVDGKLSQVAGDILFLWLFSWRPGIFGLLLRLLLELCYQFVEMIYASDHPETRKWNARGPIREIGAHDSDHHRPTSFHMKSKPSTDAVYHDSIYKICLLGLHPRTDPPAEVAKWTISDRREPEPTDFVANL